MPVEYLDEIQSASNDPERLEELYRAARGSGDLQAFKSTLLVCYQESPDNMLYSAWYYRLKDEEQDWQQVASKSVNWKLAVPLGVVTGLIFWGLLESQLVFLDEVPYLVLFWAPITAFVVMGFLTLTAGGGFRRYIVLSIGLAAACALVLLLTPGQASNYHEHYLILMVIHLPLLSWILTGVNLIGIKSTPEERFAFLIKSLEVFVTGGVYSIVGGIFVAITVGMFDALNISLSDTIMRLIFGGGAGLVCVLAVASVYDPTCSVVEQDFSQGLSRFVATMMRLLSPLTLLVLIIYLIVIPFNFMEPFNNRDILIVYNVMLFAIMGLLIGATPVDAGDLSDRLQRILRQGILAIAILAIIVSIYALSATVYRTIGGGITINRLTIIGWNLINIALLALIVIKQFQLKDGDWVSRLKYVYSLGAIAYAVWTIFLIAAIPVLFR